MRFDEWGMLIREEQSKDIAAILEVHRRAFRRDEEGEIVERLRAARGFDRGLSLVAEVEGAVVGHTSFPNIVIEVGDSPTETGQAEEGNKRIAAVGLAPMAVIPEMQRRGIGTALVENGLKACRERGHSIVVVLGHADFYPRFGFAPASRYGICAPFDVPDEAFMVLGLVPGALDSVIGTVRYPAAFGLE